MAKNKIYTGMSKIAIAAVIASTLGSAPASVLAADHDLYNKDKENVGSISNLLLYNKAELFNLIKGISGYEYEIDGKLYKAGEIDGLYKDGATQETVAAQAKEKLQSQGNVSDISSIVSVTAVTDTKLNVKLSKAVDAAEKANFSIEGVAVVSAKLSEDKKEVELTVSGAELGKEYTLATQGLKANGEAQANSSKKFTMPKAESLFNAKIKVEGDKTVLKADGSSSALVTFELTDTEGNRVSADNIEVAFTTTFGTFAEKRVTVQNGVASALFNSEVLSSDKTALITATVVEASNKNLINIKSEKNILLSPNPEKAEDEKVGATLTDAAAEMADRVIIYFNKDVDLSKYVAKDTKNGYDANKLEIKIEDNVDNSDSTIEALDTVIEPVALKTVQGNSKALYAILPTTNTLTDNSKLNVRVKDKTGTLVTDSTKSTVLTDARRPAILAVDRNGLNEVVVTFSEPVRSGISDDSASKIANWVVDGAKLDDTAKWGTGATATVGTFDIENDVDSRHIVTIKLGKDASNKQVYFKPGTHSIQGANIGDWANRTDSPNNVINTQTLDFVIPEDNNAPNAKVDVQSPEQYVVTFDKTIGETATDLASVLELQKYDVTTKEWTKVTNPAVSVRAVANTNNKFVVETEEDWTVVYDTKNSKKNYYNDSYRLFIPEAKITNASNGKTNAKIEMLLEGSMKSPDVTSPTIDKIDEVKQGTEYKVTMSEPVKFPTGGDGYATLAQGQTSIPTPTAQFIKKDGSKTIDATVTVGTDAYNKELSVVPADGTKLEGGDWTLVVRSISDDVGNTAASATKEFNVKADTAVSSDFKVLWTVADSDNDYANGLTEVAGGNGAADAIYVKFTQPVKTTGGYVSALTTTNYTLNGDPLPKGTQIVANIKDYDNVDDIIDSVTIILPDGTLTGSINSTVVTVSPYIQNLDGKSLSNGGQFKLPYNYVVNKAVSTVEDFEKALKDDSIRSINATGVDLSAKDVKIDRLVDVTLSGDVKSVDVNTTQGGKMSITGGTVKGDLTVNTPNADFTVGNTTTVEGNTNIKDVANSTFINNGNLANVIITDANGAGFENTGTISGAVKIDTTGAVTLNGDITNVVVTKAAKLNIASGAVTNLTLEATAKGVKVDLADGLTKPIVDNKTGEEVEVGKEEEVVKTTAPTEARITISDAGEVSVSGLKATDTIKVYDAAADGNKLDEVAGNEKATVSLKAEGGSVYVTVTEEGKTESDRVEKTYEAKLAKGDSITGTGALEGGVDKVDAVEGKAAVKASQILTLTKMPTAGNTLTVGNVTFEFQDTATAVTTEGNVKIDITENKTEAKVVAAIITATTTLTENDVTASAVDGKDTQVKFEAATAGAAGNDLVSLEKDTVDNFTGEGNLAGGANEIVAKEGKEAVKASKAVTIASVPAKGSKLVVGDVTFEFQDTATDATAGNVKIDVEANNTADKVAKAIIASDLTGKNVTASAVDGKDTQVKFEAETAGIAGNSLTIELK